MNKKLDFHSPQCTNSNNTCRSIITSSTFIASAAAHSSRATLSFGNQGTATTNFGNALELRLPHEREGDLQELKGTESQWDAGHNDGS